MTTSSFPYAGFEFVGALGKDNKTYIRVSDIQSAFGVNDKNYVQFLTGKSEEARIINDSENSAISVKLEGIKKPVTMMPTYAVALYATYQVKKGNKQAQAFTTAIVLSDLDRSVKESNNIEVTSEEHETVRKASREQILKDYEKVSSCLKEIEALKTAKDKQDLPILKQQLNDLYSTTDPLAHDLANLEIGIDRSYDAIRSSKSIVESEKYRRQLAYQKQEHQRVQQAIAAS